MGRRWNNIPIHVFYFYTLKSLILKNKNDFKIIKNKVWKKVKF